MMMTCTLQLFMVMSLFLSLLLPQNSFSTCPLQIVDREGRPVADAFLWIIPKRAAPYAGEKIREYTSDDQGCVDLWLQHPIDVIAYDPFGGHLAPITRLSPKEDTVVLQLRPGATVDVRVLNDETDRPLVRGAVLLENRTLYNALLKRELTYPDLTPLLPILKRKVTIQSNGHAHAEGLFPGEYKIYGAMDGYTLLPESIYLHPGHHQTHSVRAIPGGTTLEVILSDERGRPLQGAHVYLIRLRTNHIFTMNLVHRMIPFDHVTDAEGRVSIFGLPLDASFNILVNHLPYGVLIRRNLRLKSTHPTLHLTVPRGNTLTGVLADEDHKPVQHVKVPLMFTDDFALYMQLRAGWTPPDSSGRFVIRGLPSEKVHIKFEAEGYRPVVMTQNFTGKGQKKDIGTVILKKGVTLKGQVINDLGVPVPDASLDVVAEETGTFNIMRQFESRQRVHADASGHFTIGGLEPDTSYSLWVHAKGHESAERKGVQAGDEPLVITLNRAAGLKGSVVRAEDQQPVRFFQMHLRVDTADTANTRDFEDDRIFADPEGRFRWDDIPEGQAFLQIRAPELGVFETTVTLKRGEILDIGTIKLTRGCPVRVLVRTPDGMPASLTYVNFKVKGRDDPAGITKITGADGIAHLGSYPPGDYVISYAHPEYVPGTRNFTLTESCPDVPVEVQLRRGGRLHVCVYDEHHQGVPGVQLHVLTPVRQVIDAGITDENGCITTGQLIPGKNTLLARTFNFASGKYRRLQKEVTVVEGETTDVELSFCARLVRGHVLLGDQPLPNIDVLLSPSHEGKTTGFESAITDEWGTFELCTTPAEKSFVYLQFSERADVEGVVRIPPPDNTTGAVSLEIRLPDNHLTVQVVNADTGEPLSDVHVAIGKKDRTEVMNEFYASCQTGPNGICELIGFSPHLDRLSVTRKGFQTVEIDLPDAATLPSPYLIAMERGSTLRGKIQNVHGQPLEANVVAHIMGKNRYFWYHPMGSYQLTGLPRNKPFTLVFSAQGYAPRYFPNLTLTEEEEVLDVTLEPGVTLIVHVIDKGGNPVPDARVTLKTPDDVYLGGSETLTNSAGVVRVDNVPRQPVVVKAFAGDRSGQVMVEVPEAKPEVTVVVREPGEASRTPNR